MSGATKAVLGRPLVPAAVMLLTWFSIALLLLLAFQWTRTWDLYRGWPRALMVAMLRNAARSAQRPFFLASCCGLVAAAVLVLAPGWLPPLPPELPLAVSLIGMTRALLPPAVLVLGASSPLAGGLVAELHDAVSPLRVVHLLDPLAAHPGPFMVEAVAITSDRTGEWLQHVEELMTFVPVVIVDLRVPTRAVLLEAELAAEKHMAKSLFLRAGDGADVVEAVRERLRRMGRRTR